MNSTSHLVQLAYLPSPPSAAGQPSLSGGANFNQYSDGSKVQIANAGHNYNNTTAYNLRSNGIPSGSLNVTATYGQDMNSLVDSLMDDLPESSFISYNGHNAYNNSRLNPISVGRSDTTRERDIEELNKGREHKYNFYVIRKNRIGEKLMSHDDIENGDDVGANDGEVVVKIGRANKPKQVNDFMIDRKEVVDRKLQSRVRRDVKDSDDPTKAPGFIIDEDGDDATINIDDIINGREIIHDGSQVDNDNFVENVDDKPTQADDFMIVEDDVVDEKIDLGEIINGKNSIDPTKAPGFIIDEDGDDATIDIDDIDNGRDIIHDGSQVDNDMSGRVDSIDIDQEHKTESTTAIDNTGKDGTTPTQAEVFDGPVRQKLQVMDMPLSGVIDLLENDSSVARLREVRAPTDVAFGEYGKLFVLNFMRLYEHVATHFSILENVLRHSMDGSISTLPEYVSPSNQVGSASDLDIYYGFERESLGPVLEDVILQGSTVALKNRLDPGWKASWKSMKPVLSILFDETKPIGERVDLITDEINDERPTIYPSRDRIARTADSVSEMKNYAESISKGFVKHLNKTLSLADSDSPASDPYLSIYNKYILGTVDPVDLPMTLVTPILDNPDSCPYWRNSVKVEECFCKAKSGGDISEVYSFLKHACALMTTVDPTQEYPLRDLDIDRLMRGYSTKLFYSDIKKFDASETAFLRLLRKVSNLGGRVPRVEVLLSTDYLIGEFDGVRSRTIFDRYIEMSKKLGTDYMISRFPGGSYFMSKRGL